MPYLSNLQQLLTALALTYSGYGLVFSPNSFISTTGPLLHFASRLAGLDDPHFSQPESPVGTSTMTAFGIGLLSISFFYVMSIYTKDDKFKRNSVPGRILLASLSYYLLNTREFDAQFASLLATFAGFNLGTGILMGLSIGFQDGNQVDIDEKRARKTRELTILSKWRVRERDLEDEIKRLKRRLGDV
ncbi:uncharacterized protein JCM15063_003650 [Sporobolomyces koalae]|uniref:uncharacterized protein n=1 Tax=Sporobolomyces koalae TaxID=500713 RepID=UPI00317BE6EF